MNGAGRKFRWLAAVVAACLAVGLAARALADTAGAAAPIMKTNPMRPATITWGGYNGNDQFVGAQDQWPFVQKYMDGYLMHGAYWLHQRHAGGVVSDAQLLASVQALAAALDRYGKTGNVEAGWVENPNYDQNDPRTRASFTNAEHDIAAFRNWAKLGLNVSKVRVDWFPIDAAAVYAEKYQTTSVKQLLAMITGASQFWGTVNGFDPALASWREYATRVSKAFPGIELGFDQAPCNFYAVEPDPAIRALVPWNGLGYGYLSKELKVRTSPKHVRVDGKPVPISLDFADLMMSVAISTRQQGLNYYGFEGDTPLEYITENKGRPGKNLLPFLLHIERMQHAYGFHNAKIINTALPKTLPHDQWDQRFHDDTLAFMELYQAAGGGADQYIAESWYDGPFKLFPETREGTFSNLARDLIRRVRGIDDDGTPFHADLAVQLPGHSDWIGDRVYQQQPAGAQDIIVACHPTASVILRIRNDGVERNHGDCRATPLLRASGPVPDDCKIIVSDGDRNVTDAVMCQRQFDGFYVGGLEPGQSRTLRIEATSGKDSAAPYPLKLQLYWNPQDPKALVRDSLLITFAH